MATSFCPNCGTARTGSFRFCRSCGLDFDAATPTVPAPAVSPDHPASPSPAPTEPQAPRVTTKQALARAAMTTQTMNCLIMTGGIVGGVIGLGIGTFGAYSLGVVAQLAITAVLGVVGFLVGQRVVLIVIAR